FSVFSILSLHDALPIFIFYGLLGAIVILSTFLILIYLKRNSRLEYTRELEEKNKRIEIQNEAILEQTKHLEDINKVKDRLFSIRSEERRVGKECRFRW